MELHIERIELKCIATLARNFQVLFDETKLDLNWMPYTTFLTLLRHPNLSVSEEYIVYQVIKYNPKYIYISIYLSHFLY
jgi:DNA-binding response OmpR family regulator